MTFEIKIKAGFFKTQPYYLTLEMGKIILTPKYDENTSRLIIKNQELKSISITSTNMTFGELEIITRDNTYIGSISSKNDLGEITNRLAHEFGDKFTFHKANR